jgi:hypothetical protein
MSRTTPNTIQRSLETMSLAAIATGLLASIANAQSCLTTTFASNRVSSTGSCHFFDVNVKNPQGLKITSLDVNSAAAVNTKVTSIVWTTAGTYVGKDTKFAVWDRAASGGGLAKGKNKPTRLLLGRGNLVGGGFFLPPGKHGLCVYFGTTATMSTVGTGSYRNSDLELTLGSERTSFFSGSLIPKSIWNVRICYAANDAAAVGSGGIGCPLTAPMRRTILSVWTNPVLGTTMMLGVSNMTTTPGTGLLFLGQKRAQQDLTPIGMPGCVLLNDALVVVGFANAKGSTWIPAAIPNNAGLIGTIVYAQAANSDKSANALGVAASNGIALRVGK